jgi:transaldolase
MKPTAKLHESGQSLWLDNISREMLDSGQLQRYIDEYSVTGLTSNPSIFDKAIASGAYDDEIRRKAAAEDPEELFFELAFEDLGRAADLFEPIHRRTSGVDGWVSLEVSPLLADDASRTVQAAADLHARAGRENVFIKIPGTRAGLAAIEESIFAGVPVNVTLLFSREHYLAAADAYLRGIERRVVAGLDPDVDSVASVFMSRWDVAVLDRVPDALRGRLCGRDRAEDVPRIPRVDGLGTLAATGERRRTYPAAAMGQHRYQGSEVTRHALRALPQRAAHGQHHARINIGRLPRPRRGRCADADGRR